MIAEKPLWVRHEGMQIFSVDVQPGGLRFATGGGDHKVRIWNKISVSRDLGNDESSQRLLATLRDHFGSVNCVRWAKHARYLASGSDDQVILIHERKPGSGTTEFGSGEPPDIENWKVAMTLRGHTADVVDLNWSPDDSILASGSLDNTIHIWNMSNGFCTAVLRGHSSLVKGVAWDPIGSFIASQSDDKTVIIWRTSDWSLAHRTEGHWAKSLGSTFFRRLGWSPCGHFISTTHGFQKPKHSAPVLERGEWAATFDFLGHHAPIIVAKFNHSMFRANTGNAQEANGWANGATQPEGRESQPYNVIAIGSQDRTITVWTTACPRPLFVARHFFSQSVVDLSWSPDGYSLFACSLDGTVATFHFEDKELGYRLSDAELDELKRNRYGDVRGRQANLAESPAQLLLEAASAKQTLTKKVAPYVQQNQIPIKPPVELVVTNKASDSQNGDGKESAGAANDGEAPVRGMIGKVSNLKECSGVTARATVTESLVIEKVPVSSGQDGSINIEHFGSVKSSGSVPASTRALSIRVFDIKEDEAAVPVCLEACPREHAVNDNVGIGNACMIKETEIVCTRGADTLWCDRISGKVTVLAGNANFWAVGCEDGCLQVYTKCGRRALPTMIMGSAATFIDCDESWKLLLVTKKGSLYLWDIFNRKCLLHDSLASLITSDHNSSARGAGTIKVISAKLSKCGSPLVVLATRHAFFFDMNLMCWLRVADDCFPASNFSSSWNLGSIYTGELAALQIDVRRFLARKPGWGRITDDGVQTRAHLEAQLASSLALKSPNEYHQCLLSYIRFLTREADESRLREVCEGFLGPPSGMASDSDNPVWDPCVLGIRKHKLLKEDILPAMASNRKVQRLLNEFMDRLSEYENAENNLDQELPSPPVTTPAATDQINSTPPAVDKTDPVALATDHNNTASLPTDQANATTTATDQVNSSPIVTDQVNEAPSPKDSSS
ncbi:hypothetical protein SLEP1_g7424 [Rubroshorea leprosula]|uniref:Protein HIRA n=1 Tax=Rubroshorea leprosula TaxID=152421 RepID=A0AAV5I9A5_9ROSI|nr:hypothetical protein SLEP1_g7424 [Rubroshorea leprosula]